MRFVRGATPSDETRRVHVCFEPEMATNDVAADAYVRHKKCPQWGVGVLIDRTPEQRTYLFADGQKRTFKEAFCATLIEPAEPPAVEDQVRLARGAATKGTATAKALNLELETEILARPDDDEPYLVYADWLQQRSDPRGELITLHARLTNEPDGPGRRALLAAERALYEAHEGYLMPSLLGRLVDQPKRKTDKPLHRCEAEWHLGFLRAVRIARKADSQPTLLEVVSELATHPSARFLRGVAIGTSEKEKADLNALVAPLAASSWPLLEELTLGDFGPNELDIAASSIGSTDSLFGKLPTLKRLVLRGWLRFDRQLKHAGLRSLSVVAENPTQKTFANLASAKLPALEELTLSAAEIELSAASLERLFKRDDLPMLRRLRIENAIDGERLIHAMTGGPLFAQLRVVELPGLVLREPTEALKKRFSEAVLSKLELSNAKTQAAGNAPGALRAVDVLRRAPDQESIVAARKIARPAAWMTLGRTPDLVWGEYEGRTHYEVYARWDGADSGCSCESRKAPCKHVLALLLIATTDHPIPERPVSPGHLSRASAAPRYEPIWE